MPTPRGSWSHSVLLAFAACLLASSASAQVQQGDFRFWLDTDLVSYQRSVLEYADDKQVDTALSFGPGGAAIQGVLPGYVGLGFGYVAHPHLIPALHLSFARASFETEYEAGGSSASEEGPTLGMFMLRPELEIPFNPTSRSVFGAVVGLDFRRTKFTVEDPESGDHESSVRGVGPLLGLGAHFFPTESVSIDLSALLVVDFLKQKDSSDDEGGTIEPDSYRLLSFGLVLGISGWL